MKAQNQLNEMDDVFSSLPEETRQAVKVTQAFTGTISIHTRILEEVLEKSSKLTTYFMDAHGGFRDDIVSVQEALKDLHGSTKELVKSENKRTTELVEELPKKIDEIVNKAVNKIIVLLLASSAVIGLIVYLIEKSLITSSSTEIVKEVIKQMGK